MNDASKPTVDRRRKVAAWLVLLVGMIVSARLIFGDPLVERTPTQTDKPLAATTKPASLSRPSLKPEATTKPIQSLRVGDRVLADNPEASDRERAAWREPAWEDWLHLTLQMPLIDPAADSRSDNPADDIPVLHIELLRPEAWFEQHVGLMVEPQQPPSGVVDAASWFPVASDEDATRLPLSPLRPVFRKLAYSSVAIESRGGSLVGLTVEMDLPEMGALGTAIVTDIQPCPRVRAGAGHVITATFKHPPATQVLNVRFEGETEPIGVTDNHPFWSEDRQRFVAIGKMQIGERVRTYQGETKRIETKLPRPGPKTVYNLEVQGPHTYHIGTQGLLVHNSYARGNQRSKRNPNALTFVSENLGVPRNRAQAIARDYESGATGAFSDILSRKRVVPALKFNNPNPRGAAFVKFDGFQQLDGGVMELIDRKTRVVPFSTHQGPFISPSVRDGLTRKSLAISQNPGYRAVLEFPTAAARREAQQVLRQLGITNISTRISNL